MTDRAEITFEFQNDLLDAIADYGIKILTDHTATTPDRTAVAEFVMRVRDAVHVLTPISSATVLTDDDTFRFRLARVIHVIDLLDRA